MRTICQSGVIILALAANAAADVIPGFIATNQFGDQQLELRIAPQVRVLISAPSVEQFDPQKHTRFIFYALPNGNTLEWTLGCERAEGLDWHYHIQHIGAQTRLLREISPKENTVLFLVQTDQRSWPVWRRMHKDHAERIRLMMDDLIRIVPHDSKKMEIVLTGHSGGGSFTTGYLNGVEKIDSRVTRIAYLDSNYSYDDEQRHGDKLFTWLEENEENQLVVIAYDDREIVFNGKKIVGPTGGTYRATYRMINRFAKDVDLIESESGPFRIFSSGNGRIQLIIHPNPENKILHTALVGDMSGYLHAMTLNRDGAIQWGHFGPVDYAAGEKLPYANWIQDTPHHVSESSHEFAFAEHQARSLNGREFIRSIEKLTHDEAQQKIVEQFEQGNLPDDLRHTQAILVCGNDADGKRRSLVMYVMRDYLSVGRGDGALRVPMAPYAAQAVADQVDAMLPTTKISDHIHAASLLRLEPKPLTENREAFATFVQHHDLIQEQLKKPVGKLLIGGIKKDVVVTNRLNERPNRVAIYGWHYPSGKPIQPLTITHSDHYVDYSHGVRLIARDITVDGQARRLDEVLAVKDLASLLSNEGRLKVLKYAHD